MSWRGRGRGRGRGYGYGSGRFHPGMAPQNQKPFILYPDDDTVLPDLLDSPFEIDAKKEDVKRERFLNWKDYSLTNFGKNSPYYLQEDSIDFDDELTIEKAFQNERFSDRCRPKSSKNRWLLDFLQLKRSNFPQELFEGMEGRSKKRVKLDFQNADRMFAGWEKDEKSLADRGVLEEKDREEEKEEEESEDDEEDNSDGNKTPLNDDDDYAYKEYFDDDEDDHNQSEDDFGDEGGIY